MLFLLPDPTVPAKYISFPESHNDISSTERERDNKYKCSLHKKYFIVGYLFIRLVQNQISFTFCCQRNNKCRREKKYIIM